MSKFNRFSFILLLIFSGSLLFPSLPAHATDWTYADDYYNCVNFLKRSPKQQRATFIPGRLSLPQLINACRVAVHRGIKSAKIRDRRAASSSGWSRDNAEPTYRDECHQQPNSINCGHGQGSLYDRSGCNQNPSSMDCN